MLGCASVDVIGEGSELVRQCAQATGWELASVLVLDEFERRWTQDVVETPQAGEQFAVTLDHDSNAKIDFAAEGTKKEQRTAWSGP